MDHPPLRIEHSQDGAEGPRERDGGAVGEGEGEGFLGFVDLRDGEGRERRSRSAEVGWGGKRGRDEGRCDAAE